MVTAISRLGGINKFRTALGYEPLYKPDGYWTFENTSKGLKEVIVEIGHFPTGQELIEMDRNDLIGATTQHGGINKFRTLLGYPASFYEKHRSKISSYLVKKGKGSERLVKNILIEWCKKNNRPRPSDNVKLAKSNVIEFVCHTGKTVGIDVTNTKRGGNVRKKWVHKDYYKYLDELWVVVFSSGVRESTYKRWNEESPDNVKVMSILTFLEELDYVADEYTKVKIKDYINCSFHTKNELKGKYDCGSVQVTLDV